MAFNFLTDAISPEDAKRVYRSYPDLKKNQCPTCRGDGRLCDCHQQIQLAKHYSAAGIGRPFQRLDWPDFKGDPEILASAQHYLSRAEDYIDNGIGLLFMGPVGTGKTMLAYLVLKTLVRQGYKCYATTFSGMIEEFTASWYNSDQKLWFANKFMYSQVLLLDDVGKELRSNNNLSPSTFDNVLRTRVQEGRPTFMTTNFVSENEFVHGYGSAALSLIKRSSLMLDFKGEDYGPTNLNIVANKSDNQERRLIV